MAIPTEKNSNIFSLRLLPSNSVFVGLKVVLRLSDVAEIRQGMHWKPRIDGKTQSKPRTDVAHDIGVEDRQGYHRGAEKRRGNLTQFQLAKLRMLSLRDEDQDPSTRANCRPWGKPKVVCNAGALEREAPWRFCAFADAEGLAFTKQFFAIWPQDGISEYALAGILASPVANGFADWVEVSRRDNHIETLSSLPLPSREHLTPGGLLHRLASDLQTLLKVQEEFFSQTFAPKSHEVMQALLRLDAAVMDAYELNATQQQGLLALFKGWARPLPPPFEKSFMGYFPDDFSGEVTLRQYLADEAASQDPKWNDSLNEERCALIEKEFNDHLTPVEVSRLEALQHQQAAWLKRHSTRDFLHLDKVLSELDALVEDEEVAETEQATQLIYLQH